MGCKQCESEREHDKKIADKYWLYLYGKSKLVKDWEYKKERKLGEQISSILSRPEHAPVWSNEDFWKKKWPKIVDDYAEEVERTANLFLSRFAELKLVADLVEKRTIFYEI